MLDNWSRVIPPMTALKAICPAVDHLSSTTCLAAASIAESLNLFDFAGITLWLIGFFFEAVGDSQLTSFKSRPENKGKVLNSGVWHCTRHPNYFGDSAQWWGYFLIAAAAGGLWSIFNPILMTLFLLRVSGVALLEKTLETRPSIKST